MTSNITGTSSSGKPTSVPPRRRKWLRRLAIGLVCLVALAALLILLAPTLISTGPGTRWALSFVNDAIKGRVDIDDLNIGWFSGAQVKGFKLYDPDGKLVVDLPQLDAADLSLSGLIRGNLNMGSIVATGANVAVVKEADGSVNLLRAVEPKHPKPKSTKESDYSSLKMALEIKDSRLSFQAAGKQPAQLTNLNIGVKIDGLPGISVHLRGEMPHDGRKGAMNYEIDLKNLLNHKAAPTPMLTTVKGIAKFDDIPLRMLDDLAGRGDFRLTTLLGPTLSGDVKVNGSMAAMEVAIEARSENLRVATTVTMRDRGLALSPQTSVVLRITPACYAMLTAVDGQSAATRLVEPMDVAVTVNRAELSNAVFAPDATILDVRVAMGAAKLVAQDKEITLKDATGVAMFDGPAGSPIRIGFKSAAMVVDKPIGSAVAAGGVAASEGTIALNAELRNAFKANGTFDKDALRAKVEAHIADWPLVIVDELARMRGVLTAAVGPVLTVDLTTDEITSAGGPFALTIKSQRVNGAIKGRISPDGLKVDPAREQLRIDVASALVDAVRDGFLSNVPALKELKLIADSQLLVSISRLEVPFAAPIMPRVAASLEVVASKPVRLGGVPSLDGIDARGLKIGCSYDGAKDLLRAGIVGESIALANASAIGAVLINKPDVELNFDAARNVLSLNMDAEAEIAAKKSQLALAVELAGVLDAKGAFNLAGVSGTVTRAGIKNIDPALIDVIMGAKGLGKLVAGDAMDFELSKCVLSPQAGERLPAADFAIKIASGNVNSHLTGFYKGDRLILTDASKITAALPRELLAVEMPFLPAPGKSLAQLLAPLALAESAKMEITGLALDMAMVPDGWKHARAGGTLVVTNIVPTGDARLASSKVRSLKMVLPTCRLDGIIKPTIAAEMEYGGKPWTWAITDAELSGLLAGKLPGYSIAATLSNVPGGLLDTLAAQGGKVAAVVGESIKSVRAFARNTDGDPQQIAFGLATGIRDASPDERLAISLSGRLNGGSQLVLQPDSYVELLATPRLAADLRRSMLNGGGASPIAQDLPQLELTENARYRLEIQQMDIALVNRGAVSPETPAAANKAAPVAATRSALMRLPIDPARTRINVTLKQTGGTVTSVKLAQRPEVWRIEGLGFNVTTTNLADALAVGFNATVGGKLDATTLPGGKISSQTTINRPVKADGSIDWDQLGFNTSTDMPSIPVALLDALVALASPANKGRLSDLLGETTSLKISGIYAARSSGTLDVMLKSPNVQADIRGALDKNMMLTLRDGQDATVIMKVTPELARTLGLINPIYYDLVPAKDPMKLTIHRDGFSVPIRGFAMNKIQAKMTLDPNSVTMKPGSMVQPLVAGLSPYLGGAMGKDIYAAKLSSVTAIIKDGIVSTDDLWMQTLDLVPSKLIALGTRVQSLDLNKPAPEVNVSIGISGTMLGQIRSWEKVFTPDYVFEVVIKGPPDKLRPDYGAMFGELAKVGAKVAAVETAKAAVDRAGGNPLVAAIAKQGLESAMNSLMSSVPGMNVQAQTPQRWPRRPLTAPAVVQPVPPKPAEPAKPAEKPKQPENPLKGIIPGL